MVLGGYSVVGGTYVGLINNATEGVFKLILAYIDYVAATVEQ